ncbi:hypothetical protein [Paenibacillus woosongensis]|uniref:Uncharacterized protein n=1 Tax=Paenibacillus woosongensis TaxID=307580 RepID=A0ABQ4MV99_9BACL|nr:hypothetical protein [Paenibacillus woosongensis]GIP59852.1 hypothetical protein J15TS10_36660 [Paenibacillus woosongensis]
MKFKKMFSVILAVALMFTVSQNAFAIKGENDTRETAMWAHSGFAYSSYTNRFDDEDWFKIYNDSDYSRLVILTLENDIYINYDIAAFYTRSNGVETSIEAIDQGQGKTDMCGFWIQPGTTAYIRVKGHNGSFGWPGLETTYRLFINYQN